MSEPEIQITGPDAEGLVWLGLKQAGIGFVAFSVPADSVRGELLLAMRESQEKNASTD